MQASSEESAFGTLLGVLRLEIQSLKQDVFGLKSRVADREEENKSMQMMMNNATDWKVNSKHTGADHDNAIQDAKMCKDLSQTFTDTCGFCNQMRYWTCERRISKIPLIISLLVKNGLLGVKDFGSIACASTVLQQYICFDSDVDIWSSLLQFHCWHCQRLLFMTSMILLGGIHCGIFWLPNVLKTGVNCYQSEEENSHLWMTYCFLRWTSWFSLM